MPLSQLLKSADSDLIDSLEKKIQNLMESSQVKQFEKKKKRDMSSSVAEEDVDDDQEEDEAS